MQTNDFCLSIVYDATSFIGGRAYRVGEGKNDGIDGIKS